MPVDIGVGGGIIFGCLLALVALFIENWVRDRRNR